MLKCLNPADNSGGSTPFRPLSTSDNSIMARTSRATKRPPAARPAPWADASAGSSTTWPPSGGRARRSRATPATSTVFAGWYGRRWTGAWPRRRRPGHRPRPPPVAGRHGPGQPRGPDRRGSAGRAATANRRISGLASFLRWAYYQAVIPRLSTSPGGSGGPAQARLARAGGEERPARRRRAAPPGPGRHRPAAQHGPPRVGAVGPEMVRRRAPGAEGRPDHPRQGGKVSARASESRVPAGRSWGSAGSGTAGPIATSSPAIAPRRAGRPRHPGPRDPIVNVRRRPS